MCTALCGSGSAAACAPHCAAAARPAVEPLPHNAVHIDAPLGGTRGSSLFTKRDLASGQQLSPPAGLRRATAEGELLNAAGLRRNDAVWPARGSTPATLACPPHSRLNVTRIDRPSHGVAGIIRLQWKLRSALGSTAPAQARLDFAGVGYRSLRARVKNQALTLRPWDLRFSPLTGPIRPAGPVHNCLRG